MVSAKSRTQRVAAVLAVLGLSLIGASITAPERVDPIWFWPPEARVEQARLEVLHTKMLIAYQAEMKQRTEFGGAAPPIPPALENVRRRLRDGAAILERAQRRPAQIANALRLGGGVLCALGLAGLLLSRRRAASPSARAPDR